MKKWVCCMLILGLAIQLVFAGGRHLDKGPSGKVVIYTSMYAEAIESIQKELLGHFPRCKVEFVARGTGIIQGLVSAEENTGKLGCDILMVADPSYSLELKEKGMLHPFKSREASSLAFEYDLDGYWYPVRVSVMVLAYNPEKHELNALPSSFKNFCDDPRIGGAISMRNPLVSGTALATITALKDRYGYEYLDRLGRQRVMIDYGSAETVRRLESGVCKVVMVLEESILRKRQEENSRLEVIYPDDGAVVIPSTIMVVDNQWSANRNIPAAIAIAEWFLSPEGQNAIVDGWMHSVRANFSRIPYDARPTDRILANSIPVDWEQIFRQRNEIRNNFEDRVSIQR